MPSQRVGLEQSQRVQEVQKEIQTRVNLASHWGQALRRVCVCVALLLA